MRKMLVFLAGAILAAGSPARAEDIILETVFNLFINYNVEKEADLEAAISATREKLSKWIDAVESANGYSGFENF